MMSQEALWQLHGNLIQPLIDDNIKAFKVTFAEDAPDVIRILTNRGSEIGRYEVLNVPGEDPPDRCKHLMRLLEEYGFITIKAVVQRGELWCCEVTDTAREFSLGWYLTDPFH